MKQVFSLNKKGLTLIELLIGLALSSVVMVAIGSFLVTNINFSNLAQDEIYVQEQVRKAMRAVSDLIMDKEKMQTMVLSGENTESAIFTKGSENLTISYNPVAKELQYTLGAEPQVLAKDISKFRIEEIEGTNNKLLEVTIEGVKNPGTRKEVRFSLNNQVFLRN